MNKRRNRKPGRSKFAPAKPKARLYSRQEKAKFLLNSAFTDQEYEAARREVRRMGLNPARIEHRSLLPVEFLGRDLILYEPLASRVRKHCRLNKISVRNFILGVLSGTTNSGRVAGESKAVKLKQTKVPPARHPKR